MKKSLKRGKSVSPKRRLGLPRTRQLQFEQCESRFMLSAGAALRNHIVTVTGTAYDDVASVVTQYPAQGDAQLVFTVNDRTAVFDADDVLQINVKLGNGNNRWDGSGVDKPQNVRLGKGNDVAIGGSRGDSIYGGSGDDTLRGGEGDDKLYGQNGADTLCGEDGNDLLKGGNHSDRLFGGEGSDKLYGENGNDFLSGEGGRDFLYGQGGADVLKGGPDRDYFDAGRSGITDTVYGNFAAYKDGKTWDKHIDDRYARHQDIVFPDDTDPGPMPQLPSGWTWNVDTGVLVIDMNSAPNVHFQPQPNGWDLLVYWDSTQFNFQGVRDVTIYGTPGPDTINMTGLNARLTIYGNAGNDDLTGGNGVNLLVGGDGDDVLRHGVGTTTLDARDGRPANDYLPGWRAAFDVALRDMGGPVQVIDQVDDYTGNCLYQATNVRLEEVIYPGVNGLFYNLYLDGVLRTPNPRRVNGNIHIRYAGTLEVVSVDPLNPLAQKMVGQGWNLTSELISGGDDPYWG
ncbi:MAG: calcium-binding protein [Candidatus Peribacteraceae bacterium]|nr:calcium-binding protein [Candidatus Peribacteraceae bacterium]